MIETQRRMAIAVHGGAGSQPETEAELQNLRAQMRALQPIIRTGWNMLKVGMSAVDVAAFTTYKLELWKPFNAGYGASLNEEGLPELEASIMNGATDEFAAVMGVTRTPFPSLLARKILLYEPHKVFTSRGGDIKAEKYKDFGVPNIESPEELITRYRRDRWKQGNKKKADIEFGDTVGVIVYDGTNFAVCSSTGGTNGKEIGRVGDVPLIGTGIFTTEEYAASATGHGESIIKQRSAFTAIDNIQRFYDPYLNPDYTPAQFGALETIRELHEEIRVQGPRGEIPGKGGIILLDRNGNLGACHTPDTIMPHAFMRTGMVKPLIRRRWNPSKV